LGCARGGWGKIEVGRKVIIQKPPYIRFWRQMKNLITEQII